MSNPWHQTSIEELCNHETPTSCYYCCGDSETDFLESRGKHAVYCRNCWSASPLEYGRLEAILHWNAMQYALRKAMPETNKLQEEELRKIWREEGVWPFENRKA